MGLQKIVVLCIVVLIAGGIGWYLINKDTQVVTKSSVSEADQDRVEIQDEEDREMLTGMATFAELINLGRDLTCDFSYIASDTNGAVAGTIYISDERMRGDFDMEQAGQLFESHMIDDGEYIYTWSVSPQGTFAFRSPVEEVEGDTAAEVSDTPMRSVEMDHEVEYDCNAWRVDESVFTPPADIEFISPEDMMRGFMQGSV